MNRRRLGGAILVLLVAAVVLALSRTERGPPETVTGVVIDVEGGLVDVASFEVRLDDGTYRVFVPADGVLFDGEGSLSHLREHLLTGEPVEIGYERTDEGFVAVRVGDA